MKAISSFSCLLCSVAVPGARQSLLWGFVHCTEEKKKSRAMSDLIPEHLCVGWAKAVPWTTALQCAPVACSELPVGNGSSALRSLSHIPYCSSQHQLRNSFWVRPPMQEGVIWNIPEEMTGDRIKLKTKLKSALYLNYSSITDQSHCLFWL